MDHQGDRRRSGTLVDWDDARGFGFIRPARRQPPDVRARLGLPARTSSDDGCGRDVRGVARSSRAPAGRAGAVRQPPAAATHGATRDSRGSGDERDLPRPRGSAGRPRRGPGLGARRLRRREIIAAGAYSADKRAAVEGRWRTSESTLHLLALVGGWPGALVARPLLRHKTVKQPFRTVFWLTVVANCAALAWMVAGMPTT